jgi:PTS system mannose-specific IIA component
MIGLVIVTHGRLAEEFRAAMEHVVGPQTHLKTVCIGADDDMTMRRAEIMEAARAVSTGDGVLLLTDMFGGTPSNLALSVMEKVKGDVIAGVNLPMLVKLASLRKNGKLAEVVAQAQDASRRYIIVASQTLDNPA